MRPVTLEDFPGWFFMGEGEVGHDCSRNVFRVTKIHSLEEGIRCCDKCEEPIPEAVQTLAILNQP